MPCPLWNGSLSRHTVTCWYGKEVVRYNGCTMRASEISVQFGCLFNSLFRQTGKKNFWREKHSALDLLIASCDWFILTSHRYFMVHLLLMRSTFVNYWSIRHQEQNLYEATWQDPYSKLLVESNLCTTLCHIWPMNFNIPRGIWSDFVFSHEFQKHKSHIFMRPIQI